MSTVTGDLQNLQQKLETVEKEFNQKKSLVDQKEQQFKELDLKIEELVTNDGNRIMKLNVGGKVFTTKLSTLMSVKDTIFYRLIGDFIGKGQKLPEMLFFDRNYSHFELVLDYLRFKLFSLKKYSKFEKEDIREEVEYYGLSECLSLNKKNEIEIEWDGILSKSGMFTIDSNDKKIIKLHTTTCYTHFVTNRVFKDEDFQIDLEVNVQQSDYYLYVGLYNAAYSLTGSCGCCNPANAFYVQCDGTVHINAQTTPATTTQVAWNSAKVLITMRVYLSDGQRKLFFVFPEKNDKELGPFTLTGNDFRVYTGHCNTGNGTITILDCFELK